MLIGVTGHKGMLGQAVVREVLTAGHGLRLFQEETWNQAAKRITDLLASELEGVEAVINCAGIVPQKSTQPHLMTYVNSFGPHFLAGTCEQAGARLVHVSTDCVFSSSGLHYESDVISPASLYGISKAAGEVTYGKHLTVRTSFIGLATHGLLHDLMTLPIVEASPLLYWSGHTVDTVARALVDLAPQTKITGLMHFPGESQSRYFLCQRLISTFGLKTRLTNENNLSADRRLRSSRLDVPEFPSFSDQLQELVECSRRSP